MQSKQIQIGGLYVYSSVNEWKDYSPRTYRGGSPTIVLDDRVWYPPQYNYTSKTRTSRKGTITSQGSGWLALVETWLFRRNDDPEPHATTEEAKEWAAKFKVPAPGSYDLATVKVPHGWFLTTLTSREIRTEWEPYIAEKIEEAAQAKIAQARYAKIEAQRKATQDAKIAVIQEAVDFLTGHGFEVANGYADKYHVEPAMIVGPDAAIRIADALRPALD